jgi:class 3 adenylate cyclase
MPTCTHCGQENPDGARFCNACGTSLLEPVRAGEERRIVSVLFVDLVGFTSRAEKLDPEDVRAFLTPYYASVRETIERFGGAVEKFIGDAVMGVFGAPVAYGDDAERAVRAALSVRDWAEQDGLQLRIAVNTGEAIVAVAALPGHSEGLIAGDVVNTANRLQTAAPVGAVLVGEETFTTTRAVIEYRPSQPVRAKGKAAPVRAWFAVRATPAIGGRRVVVPMIGRDGELETLTGLWVRVADEGRARFVTVFGPAGIGKSRLALELAQIVAAQGGRVLRGRSVPYGDSSPYSAFGQQLKQIAGIFDSDDPADARQKLVAALAELAGPAAAEEHAPHLFEFLGFDTNGQAPDRETLFFSARVLVELLALDNPTLLLYEDVQWADDSLLDLLEALATRVREVPVLFVTLARPELLSERPGWGGGLASYSSLQLERLDEGSSRALAQQLLAQSSPTAEGASTIADTAEGNPLFIEELAASLAERSTVDSAHLPTSIRAIIAARLDSLPLEERSVLVDASVVGRIFWRGALTEIAPRADLTALLGSLEARDLIRREAVSRIQGEQQFVFKHGLSRDVAYATLPRARRRERHAAVAHFLERTTAVGQSHEALGHHYREAGDADQAVEHLVAAAEQAGRGWAKERAIKLYADALELVPADDAERRRRIKLRQAVTSQALFHIPDAERLRPG